MQLYSDGQIQSNMQYQDNSQHNIPIHILVIMIIISFHPTNFNTNIKFEQFVNVKRKEMEQ
jgi:hypothetical protein